MNPGSATARTRLRMTGCITASLLIAAGCSPTDDSMRSLAPPVMETQQLPPGVVSSTDDSGELATLSVNGPIDSQNAFSKAFGTNGRSCASCHVADQAFSITPPAIRARFEQTAGADPLFAAVDGANCPNAVRSDAAAHSLLLEHGLIRVAQTVPSNAEFTISVALDPYGCALVPDASGHLVASVYRRPLPTTNVAFLSTVMWDGRETLQTLDQSASFLTNLQSNLSHQVVSAVTVHGETDVAPSSEDITQIVRFQIGLFTAQLSDRRAGRLDANGAHGGPVNLSDEIYFPGINDSLGKNPTGIPFTSSSMSAFGAWRTASDGSGGGASQPTSAQRDIAAGEQLFNTAPLTIAAVRGLNDDPALGSPRAIPGTCTTCHDTPNVGNHSLTLGLDIGVTHTNASGVDPDPNVFAALGELPQLPELPVFLIQGCPSSFGPDQPVSLFTTDPGKALITGRCKDVSRFKGPVLRALAARAPYFHNGAAATLQQVVSFYNRRFQMNLTPEQMNQLAAFLSSL